LYVADRDNNLVVKVSSGVMTVVAGNGIPGFSGDGGPATGASLNDPKSVAVDSSGNLYIADTTNSRIRKVSGETITTVAGGGNGAFAFGLPHRDETLTS
jgi:DNA-binding beta-propeller fold protein YncE